MFFWYACDLKRIIKYPSHFFCFGGDTIKKGNSERVHRFTGGVAGFGGHA